MNRIFRILILSCLFTSFMTDAALLTRAGASRGTDSFNRTVQLINDPLFNPVGFESGNILDSFSYNSFHNYVYSTPADLCHFAIQIDPLTSQAHRTACEWQFNQGEQLQLQGSLEILLLGSERFSLIWSITGNGNTWEFPLYTTDAASVESALFLDVTMPANMRPGEYSVSLAFSQSAAAGDIYFGFSQITDPVVCAELYDPPVNVCGQPGTASDTFSWRSSASKLTIVAVPEPHTLFSLLLATGLMGLCRKRTKHL